MSKKSRRVRAKSRVSEPSHRAEALPMQSTVRPAVRTMARQPAGVVASVMQPGNYDYVKSDVIRIGLIAGALLLILIVLTFIPALKT